MNYVLKTYMKFLCPGTFLSERSIQEVESRDVSKVKVPENAFGFKFFDILSVVVEFDGRQTELLSRRINESPLYYYGGKIYTVPEVKCEFPYKHSLISKLEINGYKKVIKCRTGNWQPFGETDVFIVEETV